MRILLQSFSFLRNNGNYNIGVLLLESALSTRPSTADAAEVKVLQSDYFDDVEQIFAEIEAFAPEVIGFSVFLWSKELTTRLIERCGQLKTKPLILCGGTGLAHIEQDYLRDNPGLDLVARSAGEATFVELIEAVSQGRDWSTTAGITFRDRAGNIHDNPNRTHNLSLDSLPSPYGAAYQHPVVTPRYLHLETERYCPYRCSYCTWTERRRPGPENQFSLDRVRQEVEWARAQRFATINFFDAAINYDTERFLAILDIIDQPSPHGSESTYFFFVGHDFLNETQLQRLATVRPHCLVFVGVESFSDSALRMAGRPNKLDQLDGTLKALSKNPQFAVMVGLILGLPGDNLSSFLRGLDFLESYPRVHAMVSLLALAPGTPMRARADEHGMEFLQTGVPFLTRSRDFSAEDLAAAFARLSAAAGADRASLNPMRVPLARLTNPEIIPAALRKQLTPDSWIRVGVTGLDNGMVTGAGIYKELMVEV